MVGSVDIPIIAYICANNIRKSVMIDQDVQIYLESLCVEDFKCFRGKNDFKFVYDEPNNEKRICQWTVFLGNNGTGKTNLLKVLSNLQKNGGFPYTLPMSLSEWKYEPNIHPSSCFDGIKDFQISSRFCATKKGNKRIDNLLLKPLLEDDGETPVEIGYNKESIKGTDNIYLSNMSLFAYGVNRCRFDKKLSHSISKNNADTLYGDSSSLINLEEWILQLELASKNGSKGAGEQLELLKKVFKESLLQDLEGFELVTDEKYNNSILFKTSQGSFLFEELGYGYQSSLSWVFDFCKKMFDRYPQSANPLHESAVLLIDELDLHLHPKWQRTIIHDLSAMFPNTQFIVTTHSPLIIQSIERINLYVLSKEKSQTKATRCTESTFQGWTVEEILRELMGLDDNIRSEKYMELIAEIQDSLQEGDAEQANSVFEKLKYMLHPNSIDRELIQLQIEGIRDNEHD